MINERNLKAFLSILLQFIFVTTATSAEYEYLDGDMLLAQRTSGDSENKSSSRNERSSSKSTEERPTRPKDERPSRPHDDGHASYGRDRHHEEPPHHHHHGPEVETVVVVEEPVTYSTNYTLNSAEEPVASGDYDMDRFMLFVNLGAGYSFRGVTGTPMDDDDTESGEAFFKSLGYSLEVQMQVGVTKHFFVNPGVAFAKQSIFDEFSPGNYMHTKRRFLDMPFFLGLRKAPDDDFFASVALGPRFVYGLNGTCREYYDFYPSPEHGVFEHDSYGGKYGMKKFSVGVGLEIDLVIERLLLGFDASLYPNSECKPIELYEGLYENFYSCRKNFAFKIGWRIF